jgi:uncharacterized protein YcfJ
MKRFIVSSLICALVAIPGLGCESKAGSGALIGAGAGGLAGGIIGNQSGHTAGGAVIGAGVGALGGALIGHGMDKADEKKPQDHRDY